MKENKIKKLADYIKLMAKISESIESDREVASKAVKEISETAREYSKLLAGVNSDNMTPEQKRVNDLYQSITLVQSALEAFKTSEMMSEGYVNQLSIECYKLLKKIVNDNSDSQFLSQEDSEEYIALKDKLDKFFKERAWFLRYFNTYSGYKLVKLGGTQLDNDKKSVELLQEVKALEEECAWYVEKSKKEGLTPQEKNSLEIVVEKLTVGFNKLELEAIEEFLDED